MPDRTGAARGLPATPAVRTHRDVGPRGRLEPDDGDASIPWLDGLASYGSLRRLARIVDPLVMLANLGGYTITEIVVAADPSRSNKVAGISLPECRVGQVFRDPEADTDTCWNVYTGLDFPEDASFAVGLRMEIERMLGTIYYIPGVAVEFSHPSVVPWPDPTSEFRLFDHLLLLTAPNADHLDDWLPVLTELIGADDDIRSWFVGDLVEAAHSVAAATVPVTPAGQLGLYAPSRWHPPRTSLSGDQEQEYLDAFVQLGYAMVENFMPDPDALGQFITEETRIGRAELGPGQLPSRISFADRLREIDAAATPSPGMLELAHRCEQDTRISPPDGLVDLETWTVPRPGLRAIDLRLTYTEWLLVAAQLGAIDPVSSIGIDAAAADPTNSRGLHPWMPGGVSRHGTYIRGLVNTAWMCWESDPNRAKAYLARVLEQLPTEPPTFDLAWAGMPDTQLTRDYPAMSTWTGTELEDARAMLQELLADHGAIDALEMFRRIHELELVLPGLDEYWLQTEPP